MSQSRREFMRRVSLASGAAYCPWLPALAAQSVAAQSLALRPGTSRSRHVILLWMTGGPSQTDTFDMKPGHEHGGEFKEISTVVPGLRFSEHLPGVAAMADHIAVVRSLTTKEGDHARGTYLVHTGQRPGGPLRYPAIGASVAKALDHRFRLASLCECDAGSATQSRCVRTRISGASLRPGRGTACRPTGRREFGNSRRGTVE